MSLKDFEVVSKLGDGAYSTVFKVRRIEDGNVYALKRVKMGGLSQKEKDNALNQIRILASVKHPNVIGYKQAFVDEASKSVWYLLIYADSIVMEFATNGDLSAKIARQQQLGQNIREQEIWQIFIQLVKGLKQLHDLKIMHRDIKTANVFLGEGDEAKLGDMNVSKIAAEGLCITQTGTPYYASPEVWKDQPYDEKSDIWSLGCVLYQTICLKVPFKAEDMEGLYKKVTRGIYARLPSEYSAELSAVIRALLQVNPQQRPTCQKILKMASVQKRMEGFQQEAKAELLKTIRGDNFHTIGEQLPKANYQSKKRPKPLKSGVQIQEQKQQVEAIVEIESLPILQKDKKIYPLENSDRVMSKDKLNIHLANRDRKKSQMGYSRSGLEANHLNTKLQEIRELKLPKVQSRYNRKEKGVKNNQNSVRCYKMYET